MVPSPALRGLGKLAQIGDLGQVKVSKIVDQVCDVGAAGAWDIDGSSKNREKREFVSELILLLIRSITDSNGQGCAASFVNYMGRISLHRTAWRKADRTTALWYLRVPACGSRARYTLLAPRATILLFGGP
jgi:hypothetical protein